MRLLLVLALIFSPISAKSAPQCSELFSAPTASTDVAKASKLAHEIQEALSKSQSVQSFFGKKARGYVILTAAMVASAAVSTHLTAYLTTETAFLSTLVGQISTIGIFVLGAPIWQPISSAVQKFAFGLGKEKVDSTVFDPELEKLWQQTQSRYSMNAQMSRNVIQSFLIAAHSSFSAARQARLEGNETLAVDQIAESAVRLRRLFGEIDPQDPSIALAVQSTFTRHVSDPTGIEFAVMERIRLNDHQASSPEVEIYYRTLLRAWLFSKPAAAT